MYILDMAMFVIALCYVRKNGRVMAFPFYWITAVCNGLYVPCSLGLK